MTMGPTTTNYGSAMLLVACQQQDLVLPDDVRNQLLEYLTRSQLDEGEGFEPDDADFGGWDLTGWMTGERPTTGTNISVTVYVVEALVPFKENQSVSTALQKASRWTDRVQNSMGDGGFFFHPRRNHDGNKAGWSDGNLRTNTRSYGTATADGLRILVGLNKPSDAQQIVDCIEWFHKHPDVKTVPGFDHESGEASWALGLRYYYYQSISRSLNQLSNEHANKLAKAILKILASEQNENGSWTNPNARMREDDPLIATGFAVIALHHCQRYLQKESFQDRSGDTRKEN